MVNNPTAVIMWLSGGTEREEVFATRFQAELFMALLPSLVLPGDERVTAAILSPLVEQEGMTTCKTSN